MSLLVGNGYVARSAGNPASTTALGMCFWMKRTADFSGRRYLGTIRSAGDSTGHQLWVNDPAYTAYSATVQWNYGNNGESVPTGEIIDLNNWEFIALSGAGTACDFLVWDSDTDTFAGDLASQAVFDIASIRMGSDGYGAVGVPYLIAHLRMWNVALSLEEYEAERSSFTPARTSGLISSHSFSGGTAAAALLGEVGAAFENFGATYSADMPLMSSFSGVTLSGNAVLPGSSIVSPSGLLRYNRVLYSDDISNAVWTKPAITIGLGTAPTSLQGRARPQRITWNAAGGIAQIISTAPSGLHIFSMAVKKYDTDFVCFRLLNSNYSAGVQGHFNMVTGNWDYSAAFGSGISEAGQNVRQIENGWWLISLCANIVGTPAIEFFPMTTVQVQTVAVGKTLDFCAPQFEAGQFVTYYKPTTVGVATRTFTSITVTMPANTGINEFVTATATLLDETGGPWDVASPVVFTSSNTGVALVSAHQNLYTNGSGTTGVSVTGKAAGSANIYAALGGVSSAARQLLVGGSSVTRQIEILVEPGWEATFGWWVGVYRKHSTDRFPTDRLFMVGNQSFQTFQVGGKSRMVLSVPSNVTVTLGEIVEVVMENDNWQGKAVDGPGIFPAVVI